MPIVNQKISVWDKIIVNFGDKPRLFFADFEDLTIPNDWPLTQVAFSCPFLVDLDGNIDEHGGYHFYAIATLLAQDNDTISIPSKKIESHRTELVIDEMKIVCDTKDLAVMLRVSVSKGVVDGRTKTLDSVDDIGVYVAGYEANKDTDWWNKFEAGQKPLRVYTSYDVKWFEDNSIFFKIKDELGIPGII